MLCSFCVITGTICLPNACLFFYRAGVIQSSFGYLKTNEQGAYIFPQGMKKPNGLGTLAGKISAGSSFST